MSYPKEIIVELKPEDLSAGWRTFPHLLLTQVLGDGFIKPGKHLIMKVPFVLREEFDFDHRLLRKIPAG